MSTYIIDDAMTVLDKKSSLALFSISVNGGKHRGIKALQSAIKHKRTGRWSEDNQHALDRSKKGCLLIDKLVSYMRNFYKYLIGSRPSKYGRFKNGWENRMKRLEC
jgi:lysozyme family protein